MTKILRCYELNPGCEAEVRGQTDEDVIRQAAEHARKVHGLENDAETVKKLKAVIRAE